MMTSLRVLASDAVAHAALEDTARRGVFALARVPDVRERSSVAREPRLERLSAIKKGYEEKEG